MAKFYRKLPVIIQAEQWDPEKGHPAVVKMWKAGDGRFLAEFPSSEEIQIVSARLVPAIKTLEGWHEVSPGDFIITGVKGEMYPCKPDIFHATYEEVVDV